MQARFTPSGRKGSVPSLSLWSDQDAAALLRRLKDETQEAHIAIERSVRFLDDDAKLCTYGNHLARLFGFYEPIESRLLELCAAAPGLDVKHRTKAHLIAQDLCVLGDTERDLRALPRCTFAQLPPLHDLQQALGCLYVLEGATLGGRYVYHRLSLRFPDAMARAGSFLRGYGSETRARWLAFGQALSQYATDPQEIVRSARATFAALHDWLVTT